MRFVSYRRQGAVALGALKNGILYGETGSTDAFPVLTALLSQGDDAMRQASNRLLAGQPIDPAGPATSS